MRRTREPGLLRAAEEVVGVATQWVDPGALRGASSGEFHMRVVVAEGEHDFRASDVDRGSASLGHPFGAAFYLALVGLEVDCGAGYCCLWSAA